MKHQKANIMKKLLIIAIPAFITVCLSAQSPESIRYQSVIRDLNHHIIAGQEIGVHIVISRDSGADTVLYAETHTTATGPDGVASIEIGTGTVQSGTFTDIDWSSGPLYVHTEIDPAGGTAYTLAGTSHLLSVPFAFCARTAGSIGTVTETQGLADVLAVHDSAGSQIRKVTDPTDAQDAVTLYYFLQQIEPLRYAGTFGLWDLVADIDGNLYRGIRIGDLVWMNENLRTTRYHDGIHIPHVTNQVEWAGLTTPAYCWYGNEPANSYSAVTCGALYNWYTVNTEKLCPAGWRVPTEEDWGNLVAELGGADVAGGKLKEAGTKHWMIPNQADNESGFRALPGGYRTTTLFEHLGSSGFWWSSTENAADGAGCFYLFSATSRATWMIGAPMKTGMTVRCVKDVQMTSIEIPF